jgi:hypothetical protein
MVKNVATKGNALSLADYLKLFQANANLLGLTKGTMNNYCTWVRTVDKTGASLGKDIATFISSVLANPSKKTAIIIENEINNYFAFVTPGLKTLSTPIVNYQSAFKSFANFIFGYYNGTVWMPLDKFQVLFCQLVASSCLIVSKDVYDDVCNGKLGAVQNLGKNKKNNYCSWYNGKYIRLNSVKKGTVIPAGTTLPNGFVVPHDVIADDNTYANQAIKRAMVETFKRKGMPVAAWNHFSDYMACHVWDKTDDPWYYTNVDNH